MFSWIGSLLKGSRRRDLENEIYRLNLELREREKEHKQERERLLNLIEKAMNQRTTVNNSWSNCIVEQSSIESNITGASGLQACLGRREFKTPARCRNLAGYEEWSKKFNHAMKTFLAENPPKPPRPLFVLEPRT